MRKMRVDCRQLVFLSKGHSGNFQREGTLRVGPNQTGLRERFCRLRGNLLFIMKKPGTDPVQVLVLERCDVLEVPHDNKQLMIRFENGDPSLYVGVSTPQECASWMVALGTANTESLSRRIAHLRTLIHTPSHAHTTTGCMEDTANAVADGLTSLSAWPPGGDSPAAKVSPLDLSLECRGLVAMAACRVQVQVSVVDENTHSLKQHCCTETVEARREAVFLTGVCFPVGYPLFLHTRIKVTLFSIKDHSTRSFLGFTSFSMKDVFRSSRPHISLSLRTMDGVGEVGEVKVARLHHMEAEREDADNSPSPGPQGSMVCESLHGSVHDKDNGPMMGALLRSPVCKVYRFQTEDHRWMLVREQMSESPVSFSVPKQLLALLIQQDMKRVQEVMELGNLSPHWEGLRREVICHCSYLIGCYQETLTELNSYSAASSGCFKSSSVKSDSRLQFIPTNLHSQRMQVCDVAHNSGVWYDVITVGAPAHHSQAFKHGGLQRLLSKQTQHCNSSGAVSYSPEEVSRARALLASVARLQPLVLSSSEELLGVCAELDPELLQAAVDGLTHKTEEFVHALKDELVQGALASLHSLCPAHCQRSCHAAAAPVGATGNGTLRGGPPPPPAANQGGGPLTPLSPQTARRDVEYDEEEWDRVWANVAKSLNCIIAMVDRLRERVPRPQEVTSPLERRGESPAGGEDADSHDTASSWQEQLLPLVVTLRECVREAVLKARAAMTFVLLQEALQATVSRGTPQLRQRRDAVFSQSLSAVVCGFLLKLYGGLEDCAFLQQLHTVGLVVQFEGLLSTYGEELGMLEDMSVGVSDLSAVTFTITSAESDQSADLLPTLSGTRGRFVVEVPLPPETYASLPRELREGCVLKIRPVLFNIGINQQQSLAERFGDSSLQDKINHESCELLKNYCSELREKQPQTADLGSVSEQLWSLERSLNSRKRKNVEVLWNAASLCRRLKAVRLTSCKSAKDRTSMSVTLEQCVILRDRHTLSNAHFFTALDCMRREGSRMENVEKNTGNRKYAFNSVQLLTFPKHYRPPDGTYGKGDT